MTNIDPDNGIHYGFLQHNSLSGESVEQLLSSGKWPDFDNAFEGAIDDGKTALARSLSRSLRELEVEEAADLLENSTVMEALRESLGPVVERIHPTGQLEGMCYYEGGYHINGHEDTLAVIKSRYFTWAAPCSPCCPNAGDLDTPVVHPDRGYPWRLEWNLTGSSRNPVPVLVAELSYGPDDRAPQFRRIPVLVEFSQRVMGSLSNLFDHPFEAKILVDQRHSNPYPTYCLGHEWFEHGGAPYPVFCVETHNLIQP